MAIPTSSMATVIILSDGGEIGRGTLPHLPKVGDVYVNLGREYIVRTRKFSMSGEWVLDCSKVGK